MAEASLEGFSDRASLRHALAHRLGELQPDLRIVAEGFRAEVSAIDLLAVGKEGELVSIRFSKPDDDRATLTRALGDLTWLRARRADFLKLSPGLGIDPSAEPRALVVCHGFSAETLAAVDNFPESTVALWCCRGLRIETRPVLVMEPMSAKPIGTPWPEVLSATSPGKAGKQSAASPAHPIAEAPDRPFATPLRTLPRQPLADPPSRSAFRSGLLDTDLAPPTGPDPQRPETRERDADPVPTR
ncbi:MAG: hypothetical protein U0900_08375 [Myxococcota bacterium]